MRAAQFTWGRAARQLLEIVIGQPLAIDDGFHASHPQAVARRNVVVQTATLGAHP